MFVIAIDRCRMVWSATRAVGAGNGQQGRAGSATSSARPNLNASLMLGAIGQKGVPGGCATQFAMPHEGGEV
jgi:hypothetical protein